MEAAIKSTLGDSKKIKRNSYGIQGTQLIDGVEIHLKASKFIHFNKYLFIL